VVYGLIEAEELGVTSANVDEMMGSDNPDRAAAARRLGCRHGRHARPEADWG
jgi:hypothetical protein